MEISGIMKWGSMFFEESTNYVDGHFIHRPADVAYVFVMDIIRFVHP